MGGKISGKSRRKAQVTMFIIMAILLVAGIIALVFFLGGKYQQSSSENPKAYIEKCARDAVSASAEKILSGGGKIQPEFFLLYKDEKYNYLCYQKNYYFPCINQYPNIKNGIENEIKKDTEQAIKECFEELKEDYERKGFDVEDGDLDYEIELMSNKIFIKINKKLSISKESSQSFEDFGTSILSPVYNLAMIARNIVNQESEFCNFEYNGYMILYPEYRIKRIDYIDSKIYRLMDIKSGKIFKFAVRSCAQPGGI